MKLIMQNLEEEIAEKLKKIEKMIKENESKDKIEEQRKILDMLLQKYIEEL